MAQTFNQIRFLQTIYIFPTYRSPRISDPYVARFAKIFVASMELAARDSKNGLAGPSFIERTLYMPGNFIHHDTS